MIQYKEYKPTQLDYHIEAKKYEDWYVAPVEITRDTEGYSLNFSNYYSLLEILEKENNNDFVELSFKHWAVGWFNIILIKSNTELYKKVVEIEKGLQKYPIINIDNYFKNCYYYAMIKWEDNFFKEIYCKENNINLEENMPREFVDWIIED